MKDILIVVSATTNPSLDTCNKIAKETLNQKEGVQKIFETAWQITGPKSFEIATEMIYKIRDKGLGVAAFEIESVLVSPA